MALLPSHLPLQDSGLAPDTYVRDFLAYHHYSIPIASIPNNHSLYIDSLSIVFGLWCGIRSRDGILKSI